MNLKFMMFTRPQLVARKHCLVGKLAELELVLEREREAVSNYHCRVSSRIKEKRKGKEKGKRKLEEAFVSRASQKWPQLSRRAG